MYHAILAGSLYLGYLGALCCGFKDLAKELHMFLKFLGRINEWFLVQKTISQEMHLSQECNLESHLYQQHAMLAQRMMTQWPASIYIFHDLQRRGMS